MISYMIFGIVLDIGVYVVSAETTTEAVLLCPTSLPDTYKIKALVPHRTSLKFGGKEYIKHLTLGVWTSLFINRDDRLVHTTHRERPAQRPSDYG